MEGNGIRSLFDLLIISAEMIISALPILPSWRRKGWAEKGGSKYINRKKTSFCLLEPQMMSLSPRWVCSQPTSDFLCCSRFAHWRESTVPTDTLRHTQRRGAWRLLSVILFSWHNPDWFVQQIKSGSTYVLLLEGGGLNIIWPFIQQQCNIMTLECAEGKKGHY